jgi:hypothetical protein
MKTLIDFLALRPVWTRRGIEMVWYAYLLATLIELGFFFRFFTAETKKPAPDLPLRFG